MIDMNIQQIIHNVLRDDENPPSADYSIYEYGAEVARNMDKSLLPALVTESFRQLPAGTAISLLEGVLDHVSVPSLKDVLLSVLPQGREVTSASDIVRLLAGRCQMRRCELAVRLIEGIQQTADPHAQDNYAYALFVTLGGRKHPEWGTGHEMGPAERDEEIIQRALADLPTMNLTRYARETLEECKACSDSGG